MIVMKAVGLSGICNVARVVATKVSEALGQRVIVENKPGAGGNIAAESVVQASSARVD